MWLTIALTVVLLFTACTSPQPTPSPTPTPRATPVPAQIGPPEDLDIIAEDWLIKNASEIAEGLITEATTRQIPIGIEANIASEQVEANLSIALDSREPLDFPKVPAIVTFDATLEDAGGLTLTGELPIILLMDLPKGEASADPEYAQAQLCFQKEVFGVSAETCVEATEGN